MTNPNQSAVSSKAFPSQPGDSGMSLGSDQRSKAVWHRTVVKMAAWVEIIVGASFLLALNAQSRFILGGNATLPFYGDNRPGAKISEGIREHWWLQGMWEASRRITIASGRFPKRTSPETSRSSMCPP